MSRKRRKKRPPRTRPGHAHPRRDAPSPDRERVPDTRFALARPAAFLALAGILVVLLAAIWLFNRRPAFPDPSSADPTDVATALDQFVGAESCGECHEEQSEAWRVSTHGRAGGAPSRELLIVRFDGTPIRFADAVVTPSVDTGGRYLFTVRQAGAEPRVLTVDGVIGGGHMVGGGTQGFVSNFPDGTVRFLPFDFIRQEGVWFCNTNTRSDKGWIPITPSVFLAECADWPPVRILGTETQFANCQECHGSQIQVRFDTVANRYATDIKSLAINCESCHGPGGRHLTRLQSARDDPADIGMRSLATLTKDQSLEICFQCHALKDVMQPGYLPGRPLEEHFSLSLPVLGEGPLFPDGRVRTFAYQGNHRYSDCYLNGSMTCVDCHDPHSQQYRDIWGRPLANRFADQQCLGCHPSKNQPLEAHTHHPIASEGSRCVSCHMPFLQHPELGSALRFSRSDHTISIPRPALDARLGVAGACAQCHADRSATALQEQVMRWYGSIKPLKPIVRAMFDVNQFPDAKSAAAALLDAEARNPVAQVAAIGLFVDRFLEPDMPTLGKPIETALKQLAVSDNPDVSAVSLAALQLARGERRGVRSFLARRLRAAENESVLRMRWATSMGTFGDRYLELGSYDRAMIAYRKALEVRPDEPAILMNLGLSQTYSGDHAGAVTTFRRSLERAPRRALTWINLGLALEGMGDPREAEAAYRRAIELGPDEALPLFNLGNLLLGRSETRQAIAMYEAAIERDPGLAQAHFYLARSHVAAGNPAKALDVARQGARFAPNDPRARELIAELERSLAGR